MTSRAPFSSVIDTSSLHAASECPVISPPRRASAARRASTPEPSTKTGRVPMGARISANPRQIPSPKDRSGTQTRSTVRGTAWPAKKYAASRRPPATSADTRRPPRSLTEAKGSS